MLCRVLFRLILSVLFASAMPPSLMAKDAPEDYELKLRKQQEIDGGYRPIIVEERWNPRRTAMIVCDMWDVHHCLNATRRGTEVAPRMNAVVKHARAQGSTIIHAPSSCVDFYEDHPARRRAIAVPKASVVPEGIQHWLNWINSREEKAGYPIDHSDGGEDDDLNEHELWHQKLAAMGRNPKAPWIRQTPLIEIEDDDYITDNGVENWSILDQQGIENVVLVGVHANMCVLGRSFGLRQMAKNGKHVVLMRDMTDTMYNPEMKPRVSHFAGTDLIINHIEKFVCPTITSDQFIGGVPFRFSQDDRPSLVMLIGEQEYNTKNTLPAFATRHLSDFRVTFVHASVGDMNSFPGMSAVRDADVVLVSVRRRTPPQEQLDILREYVKSGRPIVGIRTASHAFALRGDNQPPPGHAAWVEFDAEVFGGNYTGHHNNQGEGAARSYIWTCSAAANHAIVNQIGAAERHTTSHLYKTSPLAPGTQVLMMGRVGDRQPHEPVTWTNIHVGGGRAFYTSLGSPDDFQDINFQLLLRNGIYWAIGKAIPPSVVQR